MDADTSALVPPKPWSFDELDWLSGVRTRFNREDTVRRLVALGEEDTKEEVHFFSRSTPPAVPTSAGSRTPGDVYGIALEQTKKTI